MFKPNGIYSRTEELTRRITQSGEGGSCEIMCQRNIGFISKPLAVETALRLSLDWLADKQLQAVQFHLPYLHMSFLIKLKKIF